MPLCCALKTKGRYRLPAFGTQLCFIFCLDQRVEYSMKEKQSVNKKYKIAVAQYAASLVKDGECIYVDGGTSLSPLTESAACMASCLIAAVSISVV